MIPFQINLGLGFDSLVVKLTNAHNIFLFGAYAWNRIQWANFQIVIHLK